MKQLILVRHAKSDWSRFKNIEGGVSDLERPLSKRGQNACVKISKLFFVKQLRVDLVEYSPAKRAIETFNLIKDSLSFRAHRQNLELYTFDSDHLKAQIVKTPETVKNLLLVGHNPAIEDLICDLVPSQENSAHLTRFREKYPTGAIAFLRLGIPTWCRVKSNCGELTDFVRPKDLFA